MKPYAGRYTDPLAIAVHRERCRLYARKLRQEGRCAGCGKPHERKNSKTGQKASRCEECHLKQSAAAERWERAKRAEMN